jgi:hypothetical protein
VELELDTTLTTPQSNVGSAPAEGRITDEAIADARAMIGLHLRPEGPYLQDATQDTLRNWCNGIGDLNPLYRDYGYGVETRYGSMVAHPMFPMAFGWLGRTRWGSRACTGSMPATTGNCFVTCARATGSWPSNA